LNINEKKRPLPDAQRFEEMSRVISESFLKRAPISLTVFDNFEDRKVEGIITTVDLAIPRIVDHLVFPFASYGILGAHSYFL
jgi:hypothetical protein